MLGELPQGFSYSVLIHVYLRLLVQWSVEVTKPPQVCLDCTNTHERFLSSAFQA